MKTRHLVDDLNAYVLHALCGIPEEKMEYFFHVDILNEVIFKPSIPFCVPCLQCYRREVVVPQMEEAGRLLATIDAFLEEEMTRAKDYK